MHRAPRAGAFIARAAAGSARSYAPTVEAEAPAGSSSSSSRDGIGSAAPDGLSGARLPPAGRPNGNIVDAGTPHAAESGATLSTGQASRRSCHPDSQRD